MPGRLRRKWRPPLALVLGGTLGAVLSLPLAGLLALRALVPEFGFRASALMIGAVVLLATLMLGYLLWRLLFHPLRDLARVAAALRDGRPTPLPAHLGTREGAGLGAAVLDMGQVLLAREGAVRAFTDHVTHELKTPLTTLRGALELLEDAPLTGPDRTLLDGARGAARQMETQLAALRRIAAAREPRHHGTCRLNDLAPDLMRGHPGLRIEILGGDQPLPLSSEGMQAVLSPLCANAAAMGARHIRLAAGAEGLIVADDGPGISEGNRERIFQPFFTTRRESGGTGMGLATVRALLAAHGASIDLMPEGTPQGLTPRGATFRLSAANQTHWTPPREYGK